MWSMAPRPQCTRRGAGPGDAGPEARRGAGGRGPGHKLRGVAERRAEDAWVKLGGEPGLCRACRHALLNETRRGPVYLRCSRAAWDTALPRYPRLPVTQCPGFERREP